MRLTRIAGMLSSLTLLVWLSGCGDQGWVRVAPDGRSVTIVRAGEVSKGETYAELALYDLDRNTTTPIARFDLGHESPLPFDRVYNCQWMPDSRALSFIALEEVPSTPSEPVPDAEAEVASASQEQRRSLMLYEVASRNLLRLPIELPTAANWSRDGKYLIVYHDGTDTIAVYRADTWTRIGAVKVPDEYNDDIFVWEWAVLLADAPPSALVLLGGTTVVVHRDNPSHPADLARAGDLYLWRGEHLTPFTTSDDVQAFWVDPTRSVVRWVRVKHQEFLAVHERHLHGGAPKRLILIPHITLKADARRDCTYYRFSPNGDRLAWYAEDSFYVLEIPTGIVRRLSTARPKEARGGIVSALETAKTVGFDWRDDETLVVQRGAELELVSLRRLHQ
ncbi:MAG: hypothetical protein NZ556_04385 [Fimbriimonadales bacterium]|nr:hypothetical protein [Fimbriimonadales bacterium]